MKQSFAALKNSPSPYTTKNKNQKELQQHDVPEDDDPFRFFDALPSVVPSTITTSSSDSIQVVWFCKMYQKKHAQIYC